MSQAAKSIDGVTDCKADFRKGTAAVTFLPSKTDANAIAKVIAAKTGYQVSVPKARRDFVFLTRQGCVNTVTMRANFDQALKVVGLSTQYQFIDADTLRPSDPRGGYGTPTVLFDSGDLFDMPEPPVPHPPPT